MAKGEKAAGVFKALLSELSYNCTESQEQGVLSISSEEPKFKLDVHRAEDGNFEKTTFENLSEVDLKKLEAVIAALADLLIEAAVECLTKEAAPAEKDEEKTDEETAGNLKPNTDEPN